LLLRGSHNAPLRELGVEKSIGQKPHSAYLVVRR
jgi:hypothetical protein